jgi:signal transduction histidine kinase
MTARTVLPTQFAPAERASGADVMADVRQFENRALVQELLATVPDIFLVLNEERQIVFANRALLRFLGAVCVDEIAGRRPGEVVGCTHALETAGGCGTTEFCRNCGAVRAILSSLRGVEDMQECRINRADGSALDLRVHTRPLRVDEHIYSLFAVNDISHEKRRRVLERLFFHDILNTAGGMVGAADLLRSAPAEEIDEFRDMVYVLASSLVDEIRAQQILSSAEAGELVAAPAMIDARALLGEVFDIYRNHEIGLERQVKVAEDAEACQFVSDRTLVRRVLGNMVKNALEATQAGGLVTLSCRRRAGMVEFGVHNSGFMPRSVQLQVFQRSFSTKGAGRGLGTYSMKLLTEQYLNGQVSFISDEAQGTTFFASLPVAWGSA